jgi:hypothetical protein
MKKKFSFSLFAKFNFVFYAIFMCGCLSLSAQPGYNHNYTGQRLSIFGLKITDQSEKSFSIQYQIVNTGRESVALGKGKGMFQTLVVEFDSVNVPDFLHDRLAEIVETLVQEKLNLEPGVATKNQTLKVIKNKQKKLDFGEKEKVVIEPKKDKVKKEKPKSEPEKPKKETKFEEIEAKVVNLNPKPKSQPSNPEKVETPVKKEQPVRIPPTESKVASIDKTFENEVKGKCADLVFDTVYVVKQRKNSMILHFVLQNQGDATAKLLGTTDAKEDNIAVNVYMTSGLKLTRGSFLADGVFIKDKETENGLLMPGKRLHGELEINTENRTRFTPNLVFELDPFQTVQDCDKTNNTKGILVK